MNIKPQNPLTILAKDSKSIARTGTLWTRFGEVQTPCFIPDATQATVKHLSPDELKEINLEIVLGNLYHLWLRPGVDVIEKLGGLHEFMQWDRPILTDSGGYQVYSLIHRSGLGKITPEGALFKSHLDGSKKLLTPEISVSTQYRMGSDIILMLDESAPASKTEKYVHSSVNLTLEWAKRSRDTFDHLNTQNDRLLFGIVQGGVYPDQLARSAEETIKLDFDGYALGGVAVGLHDEKLHQIVGNALNLLPEDKPRYVLGVGYPQDIIKAVLMGADIFDCVIPTRNARHGSLFTRYGTMHITSAQYRTDKSPIEDDCDCYACTHFSRAYLHHLIRVNEPLGMRMATTHNLRFYMRLMENIRQHIAQGTFDSFTQEILSIYRPNAH
ncbi:tRNA guanosine(34) transglycosylase Tgt [candidate division WWE3 bacterium]|nr:tRNA guanosine(34) transglycosylase Tgt [candidate division WWE3 bacterium]